MISRNDLARKLASFDGVVLQDIKATVGPDRDANNWRKYLGRADDLLPHFAEDRELLAAFMLRNSFATGHGDTIAELLGELQWQLDARTALLSHPDLSKGGEE